MNEKPIPQALREQAEALEKLAQRIARESQMRKTVETAEKSQMPYLRFNRNFTMNTFGLRKLFGTRNNSGEI